jgi:3-dehydroquinate dehydratase-2
MPKKTNAKNTVDILFVNGPNLGLLGYRQPEIYGSETLDSIVQRARELVRPSGACLIDVQANGEGELLDFLGRHFLAAKHSTEPKMNRRIAGVIINPGGLAHTSVSLRDALAMFDAEGVPVVEVHLSNIYRREAFRKDSLTSTAARAVVSGLGPEGYLLALQWVLGCLDQHRTDSTSVR